MNSLTQYTVQLPLRLVLDSDPTLRQPARAIETDELGSKPLATIIAQMWAILDATPHGIGLAAPQVGLPLRIFLASFGEQRLTLINPVLERMDLLAHIEAVEGCLSLPGYQARVRRTAEVTITGLDEHGKAARHIGHGTMARIFTHELDHLDGRLYIDRMLPGTLEALTPSAIEATPSSRRSTTKRTRAARAAR
jgi:peptide deformylase